MSFSRYDEDGAQTSHHMHCCIGARRTTHCATGDDLGYLGKGRSHSECLLWYKKLLSLSLNSPQHVAPKFCLEANVKIPNS